MAMSGTQQSASALPLWSAVLAAFISVAGTAMTAIAIPLLVLTVTGSPGEAGLVAFCEMTPYLLAQFFAGPAVDRFGFRKAAVIGNIVAGAVVCLVPTLFLGPVPHAWVLCILLAIAGTARGCADIGSGALVPLLAAAGDVPMTRASGLNNTAQRAGVVLGGLLGGLLLTTTSSSVVIVSDGISFLVAAALFVVVGKLAPAVGRTSSAGPPPESYRSRLQAGLAFLGRQHLVLALAAFSAGTNVLAAALSGVILQAWSLARAVEPAALGFIFAALGLGQVVGSLIASWWGSRMPRFPMFVIGFVVGGTPMFLAPTLAHDPWIVGLVLLVSGSVLGFVNPILGAVYYERIPADMLARVLGTIRAIAWIGVAIGPLLGGVLLSIVGETPTLVVCTVAYAGLALLPLVLPVFRGLSIRPDKVASPGSADASAVPGDQQQPTGTDRSTSPDDGVIPDDLREPGFSPVGTTDIDFAEVAQVEDASIRTTAPKSTVSAGLRLPWQRSAADRRAKSTRPDQPTRPVP